MGTSYPYFVATNQQRSPAEFCAEDLGLESGSLGDEALTASSSYDPANVGPTNARWGSRLLVRRRILVRTILIMAERQ